MPYGEIRDPQADAPTLTFNDIGRHVSCYVTTRIASTMSPWMAGMEVGELHSIPVSHGEGKFLASPGVIAELAAKGQIATQHVDTEGVFSMEIDTNPNGSLFAIEGITSPCGKVFGKMAHTERSGSLGREEYSRREAPADLRRGSEVVCEICVEQAQRHPVSLTDGCPRNGGGFDFPSPAI